MLKINTFLNYVEEKYATMVYTILVRSVTGNF